MSWFVRRQLKSKSAHLRRQALHQLRGQPAKVVLPLIGSLFATEDQRSVLVAAIEVLGYYKEPPARSLLTGRLTTPDPAVRLAVIAALGRIGDPSVAPQIVPSLTSPDPVVRGRAVQVLRQFGWQAKNKDEEAAFLVATGDIHRAAFLGTAAVGPLTLVLGDTAFQRRVQAVNRLAEIGDPLAVPPLMGTLQDKDDVVRLAAADALGRLGDSRAIEALLPLLHDRNPGVRTAAAGALGSFSETTVVEALIPALRDPHWEVRVATLESLGRLHDRRATETVIECLRDMDREVREKAVECLGILGDPSAVGPLVGALIDEDRFVRQWAWLALQRINPRWATSPEAQKEIESLQAAARSNEFRIRDAARDALRILGASVSGPLDDRRTDPGNALVGLLSDFLKDADASVRQAAVEALARQSSSAALRAIESLHPDPDASVAAAVENASAGRPIRGHAKVQ
jgi:HEAT repeat protein